MDVQLTLPFVSALIGWFTNYLAVRMIFRPRNSFKLFGFSIQGLIPKRKGELAKSIGDVVEKELLIHEDIINSLNFKEDFETAVNRKLEEFLSNKFIPKILRKRIKNFLAEEFMKLAPIMMDLSIGLLVEKINFKELVTQRVESFDDKKIEELIIKVAKKEFKHIEILGGILGFVIGLFHLLIILSFGQF